MILELTRVPQTRKSPVISERHTFGLARGEQGWEIGLFPECGPERRRASESPDAPSLGKIACFWVGKVTPEGVDDGVVGAEGIEPSTPRV